MAFWTRFRWRLANVDTKIGKGTLTSTTAWRFGTGILQTIEILQDFKFWLNHKIQPDIAVDTEIRYAGQVSSKLSGVIGAFLSIKRLKLEEQKNLEMHNGVFLNHDSF
jgi:iron complex outermembrane receptor protein